MNFVSIFLDEPVLFWVHDYLVSDTPTYVFKLFSTIGNLGAIWIVVGLLLLYWKKYRRAGIAVFVALFFSLLVGNGILKHLVMRIRPCFDYHWISLLVNRPAVNDFSFPSGHTFGSFAAATAMSRAIGNKKAIAAFLLGTIIGFSRIYFFLHYPSDVLAGAALGVGFGTLAWYVAGMIAEEVEKVLKKRGVIGVHADPPKENNQLPAESTK